MNGFIKSALPSLLIYSFNEQVKTVQFKIQQKTEQWYQAWIRCFWVQQWDSAIKAQTPFQEAVSHNYQALPFQLCYKCWHTGAFFFPSKCLPTRVLSDMVSFIILYRLHTLFTSVFQSTAARLNSQLWQTYGGFQRECSCDCHPGTYATKNSTVLEIIHTQPSL